MSEQRELEVWRDASDAASESAVKWKPAAEQRAAAIIRTYGDERYQAAIADVVEWLDGGDAFAMTDFEVSSEITRRFGKG